MKRRNIGIIAHIDAGKTTTTERMLYFSGVTHKIGEVDDGAAVMDFISEEQQRGITIQSAAVTINWQDAQINIIDTPGHVDFTAEVERTLRVLDGAVAILSAVDGVQAQTATVWRQADETGIPRIIFINKMDRAGGDYKNACLDVTEKLGCPVLPLQEPIFINGNFVGVADLVAKEKIIYSPEGEETKSPWDEGSPYYKLRERLIDTVAGFDDTLADDYLNGKEITKDALVGAIRRVTLSRTAVPAIMGASRRNVGVQGLLNAVVDYLPDPKVGKINNIEALVFKVVFDRDAGFLSYTRVYSGKITAGQQVYNNRTKKRERVARVLRVMAGKTVQMQEVAAGDIAILTGLKDTVTADIFCDPKGPRGGLVSGEMIFPDPVVTKSIECENISERKKLIEILSIMAKEDPTFKSKEDDATGQLLISGMGELHLDVLSSKIKREWALDIRLGSPQVERREGVTATGEGVGLMHSVAGSPLDIKVILEVAPSEDGKCTFSDEDGKFKHHIDENGLNIKDAIDAVKETVEATFGGGVPVNCGGVVSVWPCCGVRVTLKDLLCTVEGGAAASGKLPLSAIAAAATADAMEKAINSAGPILLSPIMKVIVNCPKEQSSAVLKLLPGAIANDKAGGVALESEQPLEKMFSFATNLRSATHGEATMTMEFVRWG